MSSVASADAQDNDRYSVTFNHLALSVSDADVSAGFYKEVLLLDEITNKTKIDGIRWFSLGEGKELHLISLVRDPVTINKAVHFALTTKDFEVLIARLEDFGITYSDWPGNKNQVNIRADGIRQVFFQDPDGYWIEVNSTAGDE